MQSTFYSVFFTYASKWHKTYGELGRHIYSFSPVFGNLQDAVDYALKKFTTDFKDSFVVADIESETGETDELDLFVGKTIKKDELQIFNFKAL